jgi:hydroxypyruvate isomerase
MAAIQQAVAWWCFVPEKLTPEQFVGAVAAAGYAGIDLVPREYWPLVKDHGLAISSIIGHQSIPIGLNRRAEHERIRREIQTALDHAHQWNIPNLICFSGNRAGPDDATGAAITAAGLAQVAPAAEEAGITLVLELLNSKVDHPDYQADHTAGNPGRNDLDHNQELHYPAILRAIQATGYTGLIAHEFIPKGDPIAALQATFEHCLPYL